MRIIQELAAMKKFHEGNRAEGLKLQEEFASEFREEYKDKDHCPCKKACRYHGNCKDAWRFTGLIRNMFQTVCGRC